VKDRGTALDILKGNSLLRTVLEGKIEGRKARGKARMKLLDGINQPTKTDLYSAVCRKRIRRRIHQTQLGPTAN